MKKLLALALCLLLALPFAASALAEETDEYGLNWKIYEIDAGTTEDFDGNDVEETFDFVTDLDEYDDGSFTLSVGEESVSMEYCVLLNKVVHAMKIGHGEYTYGTIFMVSEYGMSDDAVTYCYLYTDSHLYDIGLIPDVPENFVINPDHTIRANVRSDVLGTWSHPSDFVLAFGTNWQDDNNETYYHLAEVPQYIYPLGRIANLKVDLPLLDAREDDDFAYTISGGQEVLLVGTDCKRWAYISTLDGKTAGWVRLRMEEDSWTADVQVGDSYYEPFEVFDNLLFAD